MERCDVITQVVTDPDDPDDEQLAHDAFDLFLSLVAAPCGALFWCAGGRALSLLASSSLDQAALDLARTEWVQAPDTLAEGTPMYRQGRERSFLLLPCVDGGLVLGLMYVELVANSRRVPAGHLATFSSIIGLALRGRAGLPPREPEPQPPLVVGAVALPDVERENLLLLLERQEWNVSRVARLMGVTRMTVYNRLKRYNVPREHVRKSPRRRART